MQAPCACCFEDIAAVFNTTIPPSVANAIDETTLLNFIENAQAGYFVLRPGIGALGRDAFLPPIDGMELKGVYYEDIE
eukprot:4551841-Prorocentrum_lima.AAC.1